MNHVVNQLIFMVIYHGVNQSIKVIIIKFVIMLDNEDGH